MTLTELKYVIAVARERHFGRAAESCFVSQPSLSVAIKKLEEELGVSIFERRTPDERLVFLERDDRAEACLERCRVEPKLVAVERHARLEAQRVASRETRGDQPPGFRLHQHKPLNRECFWSCVRSSREPRKSPIV